MDALGVEGVSGDPLVGLVRDGERSFEVIETERSPVAHAPD
jgi:hypothetical protein